jgi:uncharacterized protein
MNSCETLYGPPSTVLVSSTDNSVAARLLLRAIRGYQYVTAGRTSPCRFYPTCSQYAVEAVHTHGAGRGAVLATRRVLRCNPFGPHGVDLVPESSPAKVAS